jgi:hypothetical protein
LIVDQDESVAVTALSSALILLLFLLLLLLLDHLQRQLARDQALGGVVHVVVEQADPG